MTRRLAELARRAMRDSPAAPAGLVALVVLLVWAVRDGGTSALSWAPAGMLLVALLAAVVVYTPGPTPGGRAGRLALWSFAGFTAWCYLSILWADVEGAAWSGANVTLVYFAVYALFAVRPWRARAAAAWLGAYALGVTAVGLHALLTVTRAGRPGDGFLEGRLAEPISYANANCALFLCAAVPALFLASRREVPALARGLFLASAGVLVELALLCQSRMSVFAAPVVLVAFLVVVPGRLRSLLSLGLVGGAVALAGGRVLAVYEAVLDSDGTAAALADARAAVVVTAAGLGAAGLAWALIDTRVVVPRNVTRVAGVAVAACALLVAVGGAAAFSDRYGSPVDQAQTWWERFKGDDSVSDADTPHLVSGFGGAGRYDIWRVSLGIFADHPVTGIGVDNFSTVFLRERTIDDNPLYPHSVEIRMLQQTGLVGSALFAVFVAAAVVAGWGALRRGTAAARGVAASAALLFVYWLVHGSVDWLWEIPALSGSALAGLGLFVALGPEPSRGVVPRRIAIGAAAALLAVAVVGLGSAWLAARAVDEAVTGWRAGPQAALEYLDRARALDPFSDEPDVLAAVIAGETGRTALQERLFRRALERNPHNWYPYLELGLIEARRGKTAAALRLLDRARTLNPREPLTEFAVERVVDGDVPTREEVTEAIVRSADALTGVTQG